MFRKEIRGFFGSTLGYLVIFIFLILLGLLTWVLPDFSVFEYPYASLEGVFGAAPAIFVFLIPALCMRSFSDEFATGTMDLMFTRPITSSQILFGKWLAILILALIALLPTLLYVYSIYELGSPRGNVDLGQVAGSYMGLMFLAALYAAIGLLASTLSRNSITAFILGFAMCLLMHYGMFFLSRLSLFSGTLDLAVQKIGVEFHYDSISRGVVELRDLVYFLSATGFFLFITQQMIEHRRRG